MLILSGKNLSGTIPPSLANLPWLTRLVLNALSGTIPPELFTSQLERLDLYNKRLSGTTPSLAEKSSLTYLSLGRNAISGTLPKSVQHLGSLALLDLSHNLLTGTLPAQLGDLSLLQNGYFGHNSFDLPITQSERLEYGAATQNCRPEVATCHGLPPGSCAAFGDARLSITDPTKCEYCDNLEGQLEAREPDL